MATTNFGLVTLTAQQSGAEVRYNFFQALFDALYGRTVKSATTTAPPGSPTDGDAYIIPTGASGVWSTHVNAITVSLNGTWYYFLLGATHEGWEFYVVDADGSAFWTGTAWNLGSTFTFVTGLTADSGAVEATATQLTSEINFVTTVGGANYGVKLLPASAGRMQWVINAGANTLQVFATSGDDVDTAASITLVAGKARLFAARNATNWHSLAGA